MRILFLLPFLVGYLPAFAATTLDINSSLNFFKQRFLRSAKSLEINIALLQGEQNQPWKFNPQLSASFERDNLHSSKSDTWSAELSHDLPFGLSLVGSTSRSTSPDASSNTPIISENLSAGVRQRLLKGGPIFSLDTWRAADIQAQIDSLRASMSFEQSYKDALLSLLTYSLANRQHEVTEKAWQRAVDEEQSISDLVKSGYRAKSDLVVTQAATIRAKQDVDAQALALRNAQRGMETAFFQQPGDDELKVSDLGLDNRTFSLLKEKNSNIETPEVRIAQLQSKLDEANADIAMRDSFPDLSISAGIRQSKTSTGAATSAATNQTPYVGAQVSFSFADTVSRNSVNLASYRASASHLALEQTRLSEERKVQGLNENIDLLQQSVENARKLLELTRLTASYEKQKYNDGKSTILDLQRVQTDVGSAEVALVSAENDLTQALVTRAYEQGTLVKIFTNAGAENRDRSH